MGQCVSKKNKKYKTENNNNENNKQNGLENFNTANTQYKCTSESNEKQENIEENKSKRNSEMNPSEKILNSLISEKLNKSLIKGINLLEFIDSFDNVTKEEKILISLNLFDKICLEGVHFSEKSLINKIVSSMKTILQEDINRITRIDETHFEREDLPNLLLENFCFTFQIIKTLKKNESYFQFWWLKNKGKMIGIFRNEENTIQSLTNKYIDLSGKIKFELYKKNCKIKNRNLNIKPFDFTTDFIINNSHLLSTVLIKSVNKNKNLKKNFFEENESFVDYDCSVFDEKNEEIIIF